MKEEILNIRRVCIEKKYKDIISAHVLDIKSRQDTLEGWIFQLMLAQLQYQNNKNKISARFMPVEDGHEIYIDVETEGGLYMEFFVLKTDVIDKYDLTYGVEAL